MRLVLELRVKAGLHAGPKPDAGLCLFNRNAMPTVAPSNYTVPRRPAGWSGEVSCDLCSDLCLHCPGAGPPDFTPRWSNAGISWVD